jgi:serine/alanine adding enzyme
MTTPQPAPEAAEPTLSVLSAPSADWDPFVRSQFTASVYLLSAWTSLAHDVFGHATFFLEARDAGGRLIGILPLVQQRSLLGNFATSIPFFNYGGALAPDLTTRYALMSHARDLARKLGCSYLELRDVDARAEGWKTRTDKVSMVLSLPSTVEELAKRVGSKLRSQVKRSEREPIEVRTGGDELLDDFYAVFACNMRDLGTPVYPKRFFRAILERFPANTRLILIDHKQKPSAAGFLVIDGARAEIPWAACLAEAKPFGVNMKLYWEVLSLVIGQRCTSFDFGRSTLDSGTFKFKKQWGAEPLQLYWHRWERDARDDGVVAGAKESRVMQCATSIWQRLPVRVANLLGPLVSPGLPW